MVQKDVNGEKTGKEKSFIKGLGFCSSGVDANASIVDVRNGKNSQDQASAL